MSDRQIQVIYEQPMNELMRVCLRLEYLFFRIDDCLKFNPIPTEMIISYMIDVLRILDRPDLKTKFSQVLNRYVGDFSRLLKVPLVDKQALDQTLKALYPLTHYLMGLQGKMGASLCDQPLIASIYQHFSYPGDCCIDTPVYNYWLHQDRSKHRQEIHEYLEHLSKIREVIELLLKIVRESVNFRERIAEKGFFYQNLDPTLPWQLIRVALNSDLKLYPEISAGKHRVTIRFIMFDHQRATKQHDQSVLFNLSSCAI